MKILSEKKLTANQFISTMKQNMRIYKDQLDDLIAAEIDENGNLLLTTMSGGSFTIYEYNNRGIDTVLKQIGDYEFSDDALVLAQSENDETQHAYTVIDVETVLEDDGNGNNQRYVAILNCV